MSLQIAEHEIRHVGVIEDERGAREGYQYTLEDMDLEPILEEGPLRGLEDYIAGPARRYEAAICDHHLAQSGYADFNGAKLVAAMNQRKQPAVLCTAWDEENIDEIRPFRRDIPCLLKLRELDPDSFRRALELCIEKFRGPSRPSRFPSRALVRV